MPYHGHVNPTTVDRRVENLRYRTAGHDFGLGTGTDAEGWLNHAVQFWQQHINN